MAETSKGGILAKAQKRLTRTKTKVLQNLGKADRTQDESFDECVTRIEKQQEVAHRLQKELKNYIHCVRALSLASRSFYSVVAESYETEWTKEPEFKHKIQQLDLLWTDYLQKLHDRSLEPMNMYLVSFPTLKARVSKRGRKQVDYDNARHNLDVLQNSKKKDDGKILKAQEELNEAKKIYEDLNNDLHTELPDFYNSRVTFYADMYQNLFGAENVFHQEIGRVSEDFCEISTQLSKDFAQFVYKPKRPLSKSLSDGSEINGEHHEDLANMSQSQALSLSTTNTPAKQNGNHQETTENATEDNIYSNQEVIAQQDEEARASPPAEEAPTASKEESAPKVNGDIASEDTDEEERKEPAPLDVPDYPPPQPPAEAPGKTEEEEEEDVSESRVYDEPKPVVKDVVTQNHVDDDEDVEYQVPSNKPLKDPPPNVLYVVQSTHRYEGEDGDELSFEAGEMIYVIHFENPEEQDEGWLMGIKQCDRVKGVFPENFTRKLGKDG